MWRPWIYPSSFLCNVLWVLCARDHGSFSLCRVSSEDGVSFCADWPEHRREEVSVVEFYYKYK